MHIQWNIMYLMCQETCGWERGTILAEIPSRVWMEGPTVEWHDMIWIWCSGDKDDDDASELMHPVSLSSQHPLPLNSFGSSLWEHISWLPNDKVWYFGLVAQYSQIWRFILCQDAMVSGWKANWPQRPSKALYAQSSAKLSWRTGGWGARQDWQEKHPWS